MENQQIELLNEQLRSDFFANITHEFKTPINILLSTTQLIEQTLRDEEDIDKEQLIRYMRYIKQNSYRMLRLVNNLIDSNKIEAGYYELQLGNHNIVQIVEEITQSVVGYITGKGIELIFDTEEEEILIACDPDKIERIMLNLLSNAAKYVGVDGKIEVTMTREGEWIKVAVQDNGIGIPEGKLGSIFERFTQLENHLVRKSQGSGIGLALVKALVEMHEGKVWAMSEEGEGTLMSFMLPVRRIEETSMQQTSQKLGSSQIEKCSIEFSELYRIE
ncbi:MAG: sensor histidine kinase [Cellulosilyticaceae bacterium]